MEATFKMSPRARARSSSTKSCAVDCRNKATKSWAVSRERQQSIGAAHAVVSREMDGG